MNLSAKPGSWHCWGRKAGPSFLVFKHKRPIRRGSVRSGFKSSLYDSGMWPWTSHSDCLHLSVLPFLTVLGAPGGRTCKWEPWRGMR